MGDGNTTVGAMTGPAAAAGLSRASQCLLHQDSEVIRHELNRRQWYVSSTDVYAWLLEYMIVYTWNIQCYCYLAVFESAERKGMQRCSSQPCINIIVSSTLVATISKLISILSSLLVRGITALEICSLVPRLPDLFNVAQEKRGSLVKFIIMCMTSGGTNSIYGTTTRWLACA